MRHFSMDKLPPMRLVKDRVYHIIHLPLYINWDSEQPPVSLAVPVKISFSPGRIRADVARSSVRVLDEPVEDEARVFAITLERLASIIAGATPSPSSGAAGELRLNALLSFSRDPVAGIYYKVGIAMTDSALKTLTQSGASGSEGQADLNADVVVFYGNRVRDTGRGPPVRIVLVVVYSGADLEASGSGEGLGGKLYEVLVKGGQWDGDVKYVEEKYNDIIEINRIFVAPIFPPSRGRGNKFYIEKVTLPIVAFTSTNGKVGVGVGRLIEYLAGSTLYMTNFELIARSAKEGKWKIERRRRPLTGRSVWIPSASMLSSSNERAWHAHALKRADDIVALSISVKNDDLRGLLEYLGEAFNRTIGRGVRELLDIDTGNPYVRPEGNRIVVGVPKDFLDYLSEGLERLGLSRSSNEIRRLAALLESDFLDLAFIQSRASEGEESSSSCIDPKLMSKVLLNEMTVRAIAGRAFVDASFKLIRRAGSEVASLKFFKLADIDEPLSFMLAPDLPGDNRRLAYMIATVDFQEDELLALTYKFLREYAGIRKTDCYIDNLLIFISVLLRIAASYVAATNKVPRGISYFAVSDVASYFALAALILGAHGLAHILMRYVVERMGARMLEDYLGEFIRLRLPSTEYHYFEPISRLLVRGRGYSGVVINGGIVIYRGSGNTLSLEIVSFLKEQGGASRAASLAKVDQRELCLRLQRETRIYTSSGLTDVCESIWRHSTLIQVSHLFQHYLGATYKPLSELLSLFSPASYAGLGLQEKYYPPSVTMLRLAEREARRILGRATSNVVKAYLGQLVKALVPQCYDGCYQCIMSDECFFRISPVQERMISKRAAQLICEALGGSPS